MIPAEETSLIDDIAAYGNGVFTRQLSWMRPIIDTLDKVGCYNASRGLRLVLVVGNFTWSWQGGEQKFTILPLREDWGTVYMLKQIASSPVLDLEDKLMAEIALKGQFTNKKVEAYCREHGD